jgi:hypothetical protein
MTQNNTNNNQTKSSDINETNTASITSMLTNKEERGTPSDLQNKHLIKEQKLQHKEEARKEYWKKKRKRERIKKKEKHKQLIQSIKEKGKIICAHLLRKFNLQFTHNQKVEILLN